MFTFREGGSRNDLIRNKLKGNHNLKKIHKSLNSHKNSTNFTNLQNVVKVVTVHICLMCIILKK